jgi:alginate O-acetyltransferase complex protein AlgI
MLFNSFVFAGIFLPAMLLLFWAMPNAQAKRGMLLLGSLVFYGYWVPIYLLLLLTLVGVAW